MVLICVARPIASKQQLPLSARCIIRRSAHLESRGWTRVLRHYTARPTDILELTDHGWILVRSDFVLDASLKQIFSAGFEMSERCVGIQIRGCRVAQGVWRVSHLRFVRVLL